MSVGLAPVGMVWAQEGPWVMQKAGLWGESEGAVSPSPFHLDPSLHLGGRRENRAGLLAQGTGVRARKMRSWGENVLVYSRTPTAREHWGAARTGLRRAALGREDPGQAGASVVSPQLLWTARR